MVRTSRSRLTGISVILLVFLVVFAYLPGAASAQANTGLGPVLHYIASDWDVLTRSMTRCDSVVDPKLPESALLYLPASFPEPDSVKQLEQACKVRVEHLPVIIRHPGQAEVGTISPPGLLFLPNSDVVPGGRFNEMYGWDSYFPGGLATSPNETGVQRDYPYGWAPLQLLAVEACATTASPTMRIESRMSLCLR